jgi:hypothetical protein
MADCVLLLKRKEFTDSFGLVGGRPEAMMGRDSLIKRRCSMSSHLSDTFRRPTC